MDATAAGESSPAPPPELAMVARAVQRLVARNDALLLMLGATTGGGEGTMTTKMMGGGMAAFEAASSASAPRIGVAEYLERMHRYAALEPKCYVVAYAYVDRVAHRRPAAAVASRNVHRLLLACLLVASKVLDDFHHNNAFFARVGGVSNAEMNKLELELLGLLDFEVAVCHCAYDRYREHLEKEMLWNGGGAVTAGTAVAKPRAAPSKPLQVAPLTAAVVAAPPRPTCVPANPSSLTELWVVD